MPSIVDVILEVDPDSVEVMRQRIRAVTHPNGVESFARLEQISRLHFMSMQIFEDDHFDPLFVFENNFDGTPEDYWPQVLAQLSDDLLSIFACTKKAKGSTWTSLNHAQRDERLLRFIKENSCSPSAQHFGAVANSLPRILRDRRVFMDIQSELGGTCSKYRQWDAPGVHAALRQWALQKYEWLREPEKPTTEQAISTYKWSTVRPVMPWLLFIFILIAVTVGSYVLHQCGIFPWQGMPSLGAIAGFAGRFVLTCIGSVIFMLLFAVVILSLAGIVPYKVLRRLEGSDFSQDRPPLTLEQLKLFAGAEDQIVQNHLGSMVLVKPGMLRAFLIRNALRALHFAVPIMAWDGFLGSMRTIHFAHWTLVGNSGRLLFLSNFDGSWESYLNDFIDKAARGLTLAWGNCVGFPRTENLVFQGAAHGTQFKAWARQSQTQNILWFSAYTDLTVNQIIRNASIVDGLRKTSMQMKEAEQWAQLL